MADKKGNSNRRLYYVLAIIVMVVTICVTVETRTDNKIANHPKIVEMKTNQEHIARQLEKMNRQLLDMNEKLDAANWKLAKLLSEEYP